MLKVPLSWTDWHVNTDGLRGPGWSYLIEGSTLAVTT